MSFVFDKPLYFSFTALADNQPVEVEQIISARVYEERPTDAQLQDHTNASGEALFITTDQSKFSSEGRHEFVLNIGSIPNPDLTQKGGCRAFWVVVSFQYDATENTVAVCEVINVFFPDGISCRVNVTPEEVYELESEIYTFKGQTSDYFVYKKIHIAEKLIFKKLESFGIERSRMKEGDAHLLILFKTAVLCCRDIANQGGDIWYDKSKDYERDLKELMENCKVRFDLDGDGLITDGESQRPLRRSAYVMP